MEFQHSQQKNILIDKVEEEKPLTANNSPPSSSSSSLSPAREFSFTISLQHHPPPPTTTIHDTISKYPPPPFSSAVDLSPADDIFFHGHLLPLHLLSHLSISPRLSTNSLDNFTLPIKDLLLQDQNPIPHPIKDAETTDEHKAKTKSNPFSSLFGVPKWRKGCDYSQEKAADGEKHLKKKKHKFDVISHVVKRYMRMVKPLLSFRGSRNSRNKNFNQFHHQQSSFSGSLISSRLKQEESSRGQQYSAPASMGTSPTNSGLLVATPRALSTTSSSSDSTMEELQAAIQAAITHCKNSIAAENNFKCQD